MYKKNKIKKSQTNLNYQRGIQRPGRIINSRQSKTAAFIFEYHFLKYIVLMIIINSDFWRASS